MGFRSLVSFLSFPSLPASLSLPTPFREGCLHSGESAPRQLNPRMLGELKTHPGKDNGKKRLVLYSFPTQFKGGSLSCYDGNRAVRSHSIPGAPCAVESIRYGNFVCFQSSL